MCIWMFFAKKKQIAFIILVYCLLWYCLGTDTPFSPVHVVPSYKAWEFGHNFLKVVYLLSSRAANISILKV